MKFKVGTSSLSSTKVDSAVVGVFQDENIHRVIPEVDRLFLRSTNGFLSHIQQAAIEESFKGKLGQVLVLPSYGKIAAKRLILLGLGKAADFGSTNSRKAAAALARRTNNGSNSTIAYFARCSRDARKRKSAKATADFASMPSSADLSSKCVTSFVEGFLLAGYSFVKYKSSKENRKEIRTEQLSLHLTGISSSILMKACARGQAIASATMLARDLIAEPASFMTPTRLAAEARQIAKRVGLNCTIMNTAQIKKLGMGAFLGVARGAKEPAKFIVIKYEPHKPRKRIAIVGKGITFDSGGLSLKTAQGMEHMKYDMSGAAAVIATMQVIGLMNPPIGVIGIVAATENMPGSAALHPGDVLVAMNKKTIEVNNTDAEGRLVLADALTYASQQGVDEIIDIATLTGAIVTTLGRVAAGVMGSHQGLIDNLIAAGNEAGEKLWQLPLFDEYKEALKSDIADLKNAGSRGEAGSASAAMFLREFIDGKPWAHMDIAGPAWIDKERDECNKGGTGFGVRTLCYYLLG